MKYNEYNLLGPDFIHDSDIITLAYFQRHSQHLI